MEGLILLAVKEVEQRSLGAGHAIEIADCRGVYVDSTDAAEVRLHIANPGRASVEAFGATAKAAE
jgi:hypothetical protein